MSGAFRIVVHAVGEVPEHLHAARVNNDNSRAAAELKTRGNTTSEDQGKKKGQDVSDAAVQADPAIPDTPTELSEENLDKVAGGGAILFPVFAQAKAAAK
jgi:hypothetical protein